MKDGARRRPVFCAGDGSSPGQDPIENFFIRPNAKDMKTKIVRAHRVKSQIEQVEAWQ